MENKNKRVVHLKQRKTGGGVSRVGEASAGVNVGGTMRLGSARADGSQILLLGDGVGDRRGHRLVVLQRIEVVLVHQSRLAVADNGMMMG